MRVLGASPANLSGWRDAGGDKWSTFFRALMRHFHVVQVLRAALPFVERAANSALRRYRHPCGHLGERMARALRARLPAG